MRLLRLIFYFVKARVFSYHYSHIGPLSLSLSLSQAAEKAVRLTQCRHVFPASVETTDRRIFHHQLAFLRNEYDTEAL
jgi:hypothetical protein